MDCKYKILNILVLILILSMFNKSFAQNKGGRWQFENNGYDSAIWDLNENNGTLQGQSTFNNIQPLQEGNYFLESDTNYTNDFFLIPDDSELDFDNEDIGISLWIYPYVVGGSVFFILNKGDHFPNPKTTNYSLRIVQTGNLEFLIRDSNNQAQRVTSSFTIQESQWTFIAVFYDYSDSTVFMWDSPEGEAKDTLEFRQDYFSNDAPLAIGAWYRSDPSDPATNDFEGRIDDVRISGILNDIIPEPTYAKPYADQTKLETCNAVQIYPNPISRSSGGRKLNIKFNQNQSGPKTLQLFNILGQKIYSKSINPQNIYTWDMKDDFGSMINTGIYFLKITGYKKDYPVTKFIVIN